MPSGWDVYYVVFLSALLALGIPVALALVSSLISSRKRTPAEESMRVSFPPPAAESELGRRMNTRFFLGANAALVLITLALVLIPCAGILAAAKDHPGSIRGLIAVVTIAIFCALGLLYSARKGDLNWLRSYRRGDDHP